MKPRAYTAQGFTLIEMLVSVAIFTVVMTIALGALLSMSESDRKAQTLKSVINNLNFSLDSMSRSMRTGSAYHCDAATLPLGTPRDCDGSPAAPGKGSVAFKDASGKIVAYCLGNGSTCSDTTGTAILRSVNGSAYAPITAAEVTITYLRFYVVGAASTFQPRIVILLSGEVQVSATQKSQFNLQTSVTQRLYDQ